MRRSTRKSTMGVSIHSSLDFESHNTITTRRRSSSILPLSHHDPPSLVGNFSTRFSMSSFVKKVEELNQDQRNAIGRIGFGNLLLIHQHTLRKNLLVEWMERWDCDKKAFVLHDRELTITAIDAALILGLRTAGKLVSLSEEDPVSELEMEYGATSSNRKISISAIERRLQSLGDLANEDFVRTFLLFVFGTILFPSSTAKIDSRYLLCLRDLDGVAEYAWGMAVVEDLFSWLSRRKEEQTKSMEGCLVLLQIWSYEHIDIGRPNLLSGSLDFPRACRWESSRCNSQRQWFTAKFNELEENQVIWELQPTSTELNIDIIREILMKDDGGEEIHSTTTNTTASSMTVTAKVLHKINAVLSEEVVGDVGRGKHNQQAGVIENSKPSSELSELIDEAEGEEIISTKTSTRTSLKMGLPPKSFSRKPLRGVRIGRHDTQTDLSENSRQLTDISVLTDDYTECSSSYVFQENQVAESSNCIKENCALDIEKLKSNDIVQLRKENTAFRSKITELEEVITKLRQEVVDLKEDNQRLRGPPDNINGIDDIERFQDINRLIDEYFADYSMKPIPSLPRSASPNH